MISAFRTAVRSLLRGPAMSGFLKRFGIDPKRYWLLIGLFSTLSERGEMLDQLGQDGIALKMMARVHFVLTALLALILAAGGAALTTYFWIFMTVSGLLLLFTLLMEAANSLFNPVEGLVLAHQPINGSTYAAAKLTHLGRILLYLVPGANAAPALAGLALKGGAWHYPLLHMAAASVLGLALALICCAFFGWLVRFVPPARLKTAAQKAAMAPFLLLVFGSYLSRGLVKLNAADWVPSHPAVRWSMAATAGLALLGVMAFGLRSLSADYLIHVSRIVQGGPARRAPVRRRRLLEAAARFFGGQPGRAAFEYIARMMRRDWHFRRQLIPMLPLAIGPVALLIQGVSTNPFSGRFTVLHLLPHFFGIAFFLICALMPYGSDHKGAWIFLLAPAGAFRGFARGVHGLLWFWLAAVPHGVVLAPLAWRWGILDALLFSGYSLAAASVYLALELRLIDAVPFTRRPELSRSTWVLPVILGGGLAMMLFTGIQYALIFRSRAIAATAALGLGALAYVLTRASLRALESAMRYSLGKTSGETGPFYKEIAV